MKASIVAAIVLSGLSAQGCPPSPVTPDGGGGGAGGAIVQDGGPVVGTGGSAPICTTPCCATCAILASHGCPESKPTAKGTSCEVVCGNAENVLPWPKLRSDPALSVIRVDYRCSGGY